MVTAGDGNAATGNNAGVPEGRPGAVGVRERVLPEGGEAAAVRDPPAEDVDVRGSAVASAILRGASLPALPPGRPAPPPPPPVRGGRRRRGCGGRARRRRRRRPRVPAPALLEGAAALRRAGSHAAASPGRGSSGAVVPAAGRRCRRRRARGRAGGGERAAAAQQRGAAAGAGAHAQAVQRHHLLRAEPRAPRGAQPCRGRVPAGPRPAGAQEARRGAAQPLRWEHHVQQLAHHRGGGALAPAPAAAGRQERRKQRHCAVCRRPRAAHHALRSAPQRRARQQEAGFPGGRRRPVAHVACWEATAGAGVRRLEPGRRGALRRRLVPC
jgi:hypothetical protein